MSPVEEKPTFEEYHRGAMDSFRHADKKAASRPSRLKLSRLGVGRQQTNDLEVNNFDNY